MPSQVSDLFIATKCHCSHLHNTVFTVIWLLNTADLKELRDEEEATSAVRDCLNNMAAEEMNISITVSFPWGIYMYLQG